jgi:ADP-heptose:LPS heptosyltransferase
MSVAALLSGIPIRAGIDSAGRGFGYTLRAPVDPQIARHEVEIYLDVARALGVETSGCRAFVPVPDSERDFPARHGLTRPYLVVNPAGGRNPGMTMDSKRYPPAQMAALAERLAAHLDAQIVLLGGPNDGDILAAVTAALGAAPAAAFSGGLSFGQIAGLAAGARLYLGNDTGLTHLAAAAGAKTVMIMGPSDPARYAPYAADAIAVWQPTRVSSRGVAAGTPLDFDWARDGISVEAAQTQIMGWLGAG